MISPVILFSRLLFGTVFIVSPECNAAKVTVYLEQPGYLLIWRFISGRRADKRSETRCRLDIFYDAIDPVLGRIPRPWLCRNGLFPGNKPLGYAQADIDKALGAGHTGLLGRKAYF